MVGLPQNLLLLRGQLKIAEDFIRRFTETALQVRIERGSDEQLVDARFRIHSRPWYPDRAVETCRLSPQWNPRSTQRIKTERATGGP